MQLSSLPKLPEQTDGDTRQDMMHTVVKHDLAAVCILFVFANRVHHVLSCVSSGIRCVSGLRSRMYPDSSGLGCTLIPHTLRLIPDI
jgi:hypothetical protein